MKPDLFMALAIGLMVFGALYLALDVAFPGRDGAMRKAKIIFAGAGYLVVTITLWQDPGLLHQVAGQLTWELMLVVIAMLALLRAVLRR